MVSAVPTLMSYLKSRPKRLSNHGCQAPLLRPPRCRSCFQAIPMRLCLARLKNYKIGWRRDENSPLHPSRGLLQYLMYIRVSMSATDNHGIPVNAGIVYYDPDSFFVQRPAFSRAFAKQGYLFPRLLRGKKFCDQMRMFRDEQMNMIKPETLPMLICDLDNMPRTKVDEKATEALAPYQHSNAVPK